MPVDHQIPPRPGITALVMRHAVRDALLHADRPGQSRATMPAVWGVLVRMLAERPSAAATSPSWVSLLKGARKYLETGFVDHLNSIVHANRTQVRAQGHLCKDCNV